jgi:hypothetical protein
MRGGAANANRRAAPQHEGRRGGAFLTKRIHVAGAHGRRIENQPARVVGSVPLLWDCYLQMKIPTQPCDPSARCAGTGASGIRRCCAPAGKA